MRAAIARHFAAQRDGRQVLATATDLAGHVTLDDDPTASALWLPLYEALERHDSAYRRTVRGLGATPRLLVEQCARLVGPDAGEVLQWLRRAPLDHGVAAEEVDADGRATWNGGDAAVSGLLAYMVWHAVHVLGVRP